MRLPSCLLLSWLLLGAPELATAQTPQQPIAQSITLSSGATCLESLAIAGQVEAWLGAHEIPADIHVTITGDESDPRSASFQIARPGSLRERRFDHLPLQCADATAVVGLAVALAVDASLLDDWIAPAASSDKANSAPEASEAPPETPPRRGRFSVLVGAGRGAIPGSALGVEAGPGVQLKPWLSAHFLALALFSFRNQIEDLSGTFDVRAGAVLAQLCAGEATGMRARLELCSGATAGGMQVVGRGFTRSDRRGTFWSAAVAGARVIVFGSGARDPAKATARLGWVLDLQAFFPLYVRGVAARDSARVVLERKPERAGFMVSLGPQFSF